MTEPLHVLAVTNTYPTPALPGDTPAIKDQLDALGRRGVDVELLLVDRTRGKRAYLQAAWRLARQNLQRRRYDLIHAYYGHCGLLARLQLRAPVVVTYRGSDLLDRRDGRIGRAVAPLVDGVIVMSEEMKAASGRHDARVIPFGVNTDLFQPRPRDAVRRQLGLEPAEQLVLFPWDPARAVKRYDVVQAAVERLNAPGSAGGAVRLVSLYNESHERIALYMNACDAMALASDHEGSPMAVREAMASNLPIVSVDVGDVREIIQGTRACHIVPRDPDAMAAALGRVLQAGERSNGVQRVDEFNAAWSAEQVLQVYRAVLGRHSQAMQGVESE